MLNKIKITLLLLFLTTGIIHSQVERECTSIVPEGLTIQQAKSGNLESYYNNITGESGLLRLAIHIVQDNNGNDGISQQELNNKLTALNNHFNQVNFQFYVFYQDTIRNTDWTSIDSLEEANFLRRVNNVPGCINIYFVKQIIIDGQGAMGLSSFSPRMLDYGPQGIIVTNTAHSTTLPHEMGHFFDLLHTEHTWLIPEPGGQPTELYENIAREGVCKNCYDAGDLLCDTPADPSNRFGGFSIVNCDWVATRTPPVDHCGWNNYTPSMINFMQVQTQQCRSVFTQEQKARMWETLQNYRKDLLGHIVELMNVIEGQNAGGTLHVNDKHYPSGTRVVLSTGTYKIGTDNERFVNWNNTSNTYKHNNWNYDVNPIFAKSDYKLSRWVGIDTSQKQHAWFFKLEYARIESKLEGTNISGLGQFQFQDPWYVLGDGSQPGNYWINASGIYEPNGKEGAQEKGVFLNQFPNPNKPEEPYYSIKTQSPQNIYIPHSGRNHAFYFLNWSSEPAGGAQFQNANEMETPVVFKQSGTTISANFKGSLLSNTTRAFSNPSQIKVIRTDNGHLHVFYISMNDIWYEKSTNNGTSWSVPKRVFNVGDEINVRSFSVDYAGNKIYLVAQIVSEESSVLWLYRIDENGNINDFLSNYVSEVDVNIDAMPVIGVNETFVPNTSYIATNILLIFRKNNSEGLKFLRLRNVLNNWESTDIINIPNTNSNSFNPALSLVKSLFCTKIYTHFVWEERRGVRSSKLFYCKVDVSPDEIEENDFRDYKEISRGSGYEVHTNPVIIEMGENDALIGFVGKRGYEEESITPEESRAVLAGLSLGGTFYSYGDDVKSVSINKSSTRWTFAWTRGNDNAIQYMDSRDLRRVWQLGNLRGSEIAISNGYTADQMFAFALNTSESPYPINYRAIYGEYIPEELVITEDAREGVVEKDGAVVYYSIGDIKVGEEKVEFVKIPEDTTGIITLSNANRYLISKPFMVNDHTGFVYTVRYGVTDSSALKEALSNTDYIRFRVELIDALTKELLGVFDEVEYNSESVSKYENISYYVNTSGLGERFVQLRLVISNNIDPYYALSDKFSDREYNLQKKRGYKEISYRGKLESKEFSYSLQQNYPNPFNPTTKVRYSVKDNVKVTLKLYDILGREVATLLSEEKTPGGYEIIIDAGKLGLSSGMYIYQMRAGEFSSIKKFVLVK